MDIFNKRTSIMKKKIWLIILGLSFPTYAQNTEEMNKNELKIALKNAIYSKDSLILVNNDKILDISLLNQKLNEANDSIKAQKLKINSLYSLKRQSDDNSKVLLEKLTFLNDSISKIKLSVKTDFNVTVFSTIPEEYAGCSYLFAETKENYKAKKYLYFDDFGTTCLISINNETITLKKNAIKGDDVVIYSNDTYTTYIHKIKNIGQNGEENQIYMAELVITNKAGQVVIKKIYGEGGC